MSDKHVCGIHIADFLEGTVGLSLEACGLYIKLIVAMDRDGGRLCWEPREVMAMVGLRDLRTLDRVMEELTAGRRPKLAVIPDGDGLPWLYGRRVLTINRRLATAVTEWGLTAAQLAPLGYDPRAILRSTRRRAARGGGGGGGRGRPQAGDKPPETAVMSGDSRPQVGEKSADSRASLPDETQRNQALGLDPLYHTVLHTSSPHPPMVEVVPRDDAGGGAPMAGDGAGQRPSMRLGEMVGGLDTASPRSTGPFAPGIVAVESCRSWRDVEGLWARTGRWIGIGGPPGSAGYLGPNVTRH